MGAFKQLNSQDIIVSPLELNKAFEARSVPPTGSPGYDFVNYGFTLYGGDPPKAYNFSNIEGIDVYIGYNRKFSTSDTQTGYFKRYYESSVFDSIKHLYYHNFLSGSYISGSHVMSDAERPDYLSDGTISGSLYNTNYFDYPQTDLLQDKTFPTVPTALVGVISISPGLFGDMIQPGSFKFSAPAFSGSGGGTLVDDGEGRIKSGSIHVGNIIYTHGIVTLTSFVSESGYSFQDYGDPEYGLPPSTDEWFKSWVSGSEATASFSSSYTIYETQYKCTIGDSEYNYSQNPSALVDDNGTPYDYVTGSYFTPYVTTVGLYNDAYELLAVGKLAKPLPTSDLTDTTILVNIDRQ